MAKSIFEKTKSLFIQEDTDVPMNRGNQRDPSDPSLDFIEQSTRSYGQSIHVEPTTEEIKVADIDTSDLITVDEVYHSNLLDDKEKSIYKVNQIKAALPDMPTDAKKASVLGMLSVSNIAIDEITADSKKRTDALIGSLNNFTNETQTIVDDATASIQQKEKEIEELRNKISERKTLQEKQQGLFEEELNSIKSTLDFIS